MGYVSTDTSLTISCKSKSFQIWVLIFLLLLAAHIGFLDIILYYGNETKTWTTTNPYLKPWLMILMTSNPDHVPALHKNIYLVSMGQVQGYGQGYG